MYVYEKLVSEFCFNMRRRVDTVRAWASPETHPGRLWKHAIGILQSEQLPAAIVALYIIRVSSDASRIARLSMLNASWSF